MFPKKFLIMITIMAIIAFVLLTIFRPEPSIESPLPITVEIDREASRLTMDGETIFPFGFYHVSWAGTEEAKYTALREIAAAGFNLMHPALDTDDEPFLDLARELGVYLIIEINDANGTEPMVEAFRDHPTIIGWLIADDFNSPEQDHTPQSIRESHELVKSIAPNHLTYMSGSTNNLAQYVELNDIIGIQTYSVPSDPLSTTNSLLQNAISATAAYERTIIANIQVYNSLGKRPPTPSEIRNMTYQALLSGVDGILYYTYLDPIWDVEDHPEIWQGLIELADEVQTITPILLNGKLSSIASPYTGVVLGQWEYEGARYLVIINTLDEIVEEFEIGVQTDSMQSLFTTQPQDLTLQNQLLAGNLAPEEVYVLVLR